MPAAVGLEKMKCSPKAESPVLSPLSSANGTLSLSSHSNGTVQIPSSSTQQQQRCFSVETQRNAQSTSPDEPIRNAIAALIQSMESLSLVRQSTVVLGANDFEVVASASATAAHGNDSATFLARNVDKAVIPDLDEYRTAPGEPINVKDGDLEIHVYTLNDSDPENEQLEGCEDELAAGMEGYGCFVVYVKQGRIHGQ